MAARWSRWSPVTSTMQCWSSRLPRRSKSSLTKAERPVPDVHLDQRAAIVLGGAEHAPEVDEIIEVLDKPRQNAVVNLANVAPARRPHFFESLFARLQEMRARTGRPHWLVVDEIEELSPVGWDLGSLRRGQDLMGLLLITRRAGAVPLPVLRSVDAIFAIGRAPAATIRDLAGVLGEPAPGVPDVELQSGEAIAWWRSRGQAPFWLRGVPGPERPPDHRAAGAPAEVP